MCNIPDHKQTKTIQSGPDNSILFLFRLLIFAKAGKCSRGGHLMILDDLMCSEETLNILTLRILLQVSMHKITLATENKHHEDDEQKEAASIGFRTLCWLIIRDFPIDDIIQHVIVLIRMIVHTHSLRGLLIYNPFAK